MSYHKALLVPVEGPIQEVEIPDRETGGSLDALQALVGGMIENVPLPEFIPGWETTSAFINEEGKLIQLDPNMRATDFFVPGVGLFWGDYIAGPMVLMGFDPETGENTDEVPAGVVRRIRLIESEAS